MQFLTLWTSLNYGLLRFNYSISIQYWLTTCTWARKSTADYWLRSWLLRAFLARGLKRASKEIQDVSDSDGKGENYQRALTLLKEAVDILRSPCTSTDHQQKLPAHRSVGSVQVPATSERENYNKWLVFFRFTVRAHLPVKLVPVDPSSDFDQVLPQVGPQKVLNQRKPGLIILSSACVNQTSW